MKIGAANATAVEVTDTVTGEIVEYASIRQVARELNANFTTIRNYIQSKKPYLGRYLISIKS